MQVRRAMDSRLFKLIVALALGMAFIVATPTPVQAKTPKVKRHKVVKGDTLGSVAKRYKCSVDAVRSANKIKGDVIRRGQRLVIPKCGDGGREGGTQVMSHTVLPGETLAFIAKRYASTVKKIKARNGLRTTMLRIGQVLKVRSLVPVRARRKFVYTIRRGDTLSAIGARFGMSARDIQALNPRKKANSLRIGGRITLYKEGPAKLSKTVGKPQRGRLVDGEQLPKGPGYYRRRPHRAWGTNETITLLLRVIAEVKTKHPKVHDLAIGDLSKKGGGRLSGHASHQSGRDVDLGLYFKKQRASGPKKFLNALKHKLDYAATWTLLTALAGPSRSRSRVEYIFLDYRVQEKIYKWAKRHKKASQATLDWMFQYPKGRRRLNGMIRHWPKHPDHLHVRFRCPRGQKGCG